MKTRELRKLIIWAKGEIDAYEKFIIKCEKEIKKFKKKKLKK